MKMMMLGAVGFLLLALLGGGGWFAYRKFVASKAPSAAVAQNQPADAAKEKSDEDEDAEEPASGGEGEGKSAGPAILVYKSNLNVEGKKNAYLVVELHILFRDAELGKQATSDKPTVENSIIRSMINTLLSGKTLEEVSDLEVQEAIRLDIKDKLNEKFAPKPPPAGEKVDKKKQRPKHPIKDVLVISWAIAQ